MVGDDAENVGPPPTLCPLPPAMIYTQGGLRTLNSVVHRKQARFASDISTLEIDNQQVELIVRLFFFSFAHRPMLLVSGEKAYLPPTVLVEVILLDDNDGLANVERDFILSLGFEIVYGPHSLWHCAYVWVCVDDLELYRARERVDLGAVVPFFFRVLSKVGRRENKGSRDTTGEEQNESTGVQSQSINGSRWGKR